MRELKFKDGDVIGNLKIIKKDKVRETKGGARVGNVIEVLNYINNKKIKER